MSIQVPYPFITQEGAGRPIQVHNRKGLTSGGCYLPTPALDGFTIHLDYSLKKTQPREIRLRESRS